ncbi:MarR family winged helix-turn-helix transcriptional regulator [Glaciecola sp. 1036]|uniref:MarR family winged helix-turn-helix transcriptional regulator n=1 Tax=Alteromonadaceae TaxID=72275 RepID=UPI003CFE4EEE
MDPNKKNLLTLERYLPYRLSVLSNKVSGKIAQSYKDKFALSITEWRIMAVLGEYPGVSADEVSVKTQIEKSLISRAVSKLLQRQLICRTLSKEDKRRSELHLSNTGTEVYNEIVPLSLEYERKLLSCLNSEQEQQLSQIIDQLYQRANEMKL